MKVRLLTSISAPSFSYRAGHEVDVSERFGRELIAAGYATLVAPTKPKRGAGRPKKETATRKRDAERAVADQ